MDFREILYTYALWCNQELCRFSWSSGQNSGRPARFPVNCKNSLRTLYNENRLRDFHEIHWTCSLWHRLQVFRFWWSLDYNSGRQAGFPQNLQIACKRPDDQSFHRTTVKNWPVLDNIIRHKCTKFQENPSSRFQHMTITNEFKSYE